tara:strand:+ start:592 stop:2010 length:1419 start_codon:yes stop_codon:yes gene_type:complete
MEKVIQTDIIVIGAGPGGYAAAFRAADLGKKVVLVEKSNHLGGVCLNRGCIPSKALLHLAKVIEDSKSIKKSGITFANPEIDIDKIREWKDSIINQLEKGINQLTKRRNITLIKGTATFESENKLIIKSNETTQEIIFNNCIIATGSKANLMPNLPQDHPRILYSSSALSLPKIPKKMLVIGGGYIGLELGSVYSALGSEITVIESMSTLLPNADTDLVKPLYLKLKKEFSNIYLSTKVSKIDPNDNNVIVSFEKEDNSTFNENFDMVLISVGRRPNTANLLLENAGIIIDEKGFIPVNDKRQTNINNIYAIGDITGDPMLAHKATYEGKVAAEVICDLPSAFEPAVIPAVIFTDPEIAWAGPTETELNEKGIKFSKGEFPWVASGKALAIGQTKGKTKLLFDPDTKKIISIGIVGPEAGNLIGEGVLAIEMGADAEDIGLSIHPHPTLSETIVNAAEVFSGTITDLYIPKK